MVKLKRPIFNGQKVGNHVWLERKEIDEGRKQRRVKQVRFQFSKGDIVIAKRRNMELGTTAKVGVRFYGPFKIMERLPGYNFKLKGLRFNDELIINGRRLKVFKFKRELAVMNRVSSELPECRKYGNKQSMGCYYGAQKGREYGEKRNCRNERKWVIGKEEKVGNRKPVNYKY